MRRPVPQATRCFFFGVAWAARPVHSAPQVLYLGQEVPLWGSRSGQDRRFLPPAGGIAKDAEERHVFCSGWARLAPKPGDGLAPPADPKADPKPETQSTTPAQALANINQPLGALAPLGSVTSLEVSKPVLPNVVTARGEVTPPVSVNQAPVTTVNGALLPVVVNNTGSDIRVSGIIAWDAPEDIGVLAITVEACTPSDVDCDKKPESIDEKAADDQDNQDNANAGPPAPTLEQVKEEALRLAEKELGQDGVDAVNALFASLQGNEEDQKAALAVVSLGISAGIVDTNGIKELEAQLTGREVMVCAPACAENALLAAVALLAAITWLIGKAAEAAVNGVSVTWPAPPVAGSPVRPWPQPNLLPPPSGALRIATADQATYLGSLMRSGIVSRTLADNGKKQDGVNLDSGAILLLTAINKMPDPKELALLTNALANKKMVISFTAVFEVLEGSAEHAGLRELTSIMALLTVAELVLPQVPPPMALVPNRPERDHVNDPIDKQIFGTGVALGIPTITSDFSYADHIDSTWRSANGGSFTEPRDYRLIRSRKYTGR
jgi:hypothetical protein